MSQAVFPKSVMPWTDRIDEVNVIWANDPNSLAAEVIAIENTLGVMPQVEKAPYSGSAVSYGSVDARISDAVAGNLHPYCSINVSSFFCYNNQGPGTFWGHFNTFSKIYDPFGFYNGSDITVPASGLYLITGSQSWGWHDSGYLRHALYIDGDWMCEHRWDWSFPALSPTNPLTTLISLEGPYFPGYWSPERPANTAFTWMGAIPAGKRVQVVSENGTSFNPYPISNSWLRIYCLRKLPANALG